MYLVAAGLVASMCLEGCLLQHCVVLLKQHALQCWPGVTPMHVAVMHMLSLNTCSTGTRLSEYLTTF